MGGGTEQGNNSARGTLTVTARVSNGSSRHAMPSISNLVYAALLYPDNESPGNPPSADFVKGTKAADSDNLIFSFQKPENTSGNFTLEVFAFVKADVVAEDGTANFSRSGAPFSKAETGLTITGDAINVGDIALEVNNSSEEKGTVALQIKVPDGCSLIIDDMTNFAITGSSPNFTITQNGTGISAGTYPVNFTVKKDAETVYIFAESINVLPGMHTDTWWNGNVSSEIKDVAQSMSTTLYVRGAGGWYDSTSPYNEGTTAAASDTNLGSFSSPLATIQKAIDTVIAMNDGTSEYTICIDGTLTQSEAAQMATFSSLKKELTLTIKALSDTATLDGGARLDADGNVTAEGSKNRIIYAKPGTNGILNLTLENLVITGGNTTGYGGGIYIGGSTLKMKDCTVEGNAVTSLDGGGICVISGALTMERCTISGNASKGSGGGVYVYNSGTLKTEKCVFSGNISNGLGGAIFLSTNAEATMTDDEIKGNTASGGGGAYVDGGTLTMKNCKVEGNIATSYYAGGIGVRYGGTITMDGGTISGNGVEGSASNANYGGGVYVIHSGSTFTMKGDATISGNILSESTTNREGSGVYVNYSGTFEMEGGTISGGNAKLGGGVYVTGGASNFKMSGGTITGNTATASGGGVYVEGGTFTMSGGTIGGNSATTQGNGVYITATISANSVMGTFNMIGSAKVEEDNDVYLSASGSNVATITVAGDLTADSPVATITPSAYEARQVLSADGTKVTAITQDICDKFALSPNPAGGIWQIVPDGTGANGVLTRPDTIYLDSSNGSDTNSGLTASKAVQTLSKAIELYDTYNAQKIMVCAEYALPIEESTLLDRAGKTKVTLMRYDGSSDVSGAFTGNLLTISQGDVTISNVTLDGNKENVTATESLLVISGSDTTVTLGDGATLCNNKNSSSAVLSSGAVYVNNKATLKMTGGAITKNETDGFGGGIHVNGYYSTFEMSGGEISDNHAPNHSGGGVFGCGLFNMSGGTIRNNTSKWGGGVMINGVDVRDFNMTGGKIINNTATVYGGGVYTASKFTMSGGEITGNTAANNGGGVYKEASGTFTQTGTGGTVHDNTPDDIYEEPSS